MKTKKTESNIMETKVKFTKEHLEAIIKAHWDYNSSEHGMDNDYNVRDINGVLINLGVQTRIEPSGYTVIFKD